MSDSKWGMENDPMLKIEVDAYHANRKPAADTPIPSEEEQPLDERCYQAGYRDGFAAQAQAVEGLRNKVRWLDKAAKMDDNSIREARERTKALEAERDRMREALEKIADAYSAASSGTTRFSKADCVCIARSALKPYVKTEKDNG